MRLIRCRDEDYYRDRMQRYVNTHAEPEPEPEDEAGGVAAMPEQNEDEEVGGA